MDEPSVQSHYDLCCDERDTILIHSYQILGHFNTKSQNCHQIQYRRTLLTLYTLPELT